MNTDKLATLIDQHRGLQTAYRQLSERYRTAVNDAAKLAASMTVEIDDAAEWIVRKPVEELAATPPEELEAAGLTASQARRLITARRLVARLQGETEERAEALQQSQAVVDRLVEYARQRGELVDL